MKSIAPLLLALLLAGGTVSANAETAKAIFAGGCFWCVEEAMDKVPGVISTTSGYIGGTTKNPSYEQVSSGTTGYVEAVEVAYDPSKVSYEALLDAFWKNHDPTVNNRQFCDVGTQYPLPVLTSIEKAGTFWPAETYHQDFYKKNPARYKFYATGCGRYRRLEELWGKH